MLYYTAELLYTKLQQKHRFVRGSRGLQRSHTTWEVTHRLVHGAAESVRSSYDHYVCCMTGRDGTGRRIYGQVN